MVGRKSFISVEKRILLQLLNFQRYKIDYDVPAALTQYGLSQAVGTTTGYVSSAIKKLKSQDYVEEKTGRVRGKIKIQKYFFLTDKGIKYARKLKKNLLKQKIRLKSSDGIIGPMPIKDLLPYLNENEICSNFTELDIYKSASKDGTLDVGYLNKIRERQYVDFSSDAPDLLYFFGRDNEIALLEKWIEYKENNNIIFVHGMVGIGKTTLAAKLIDNYRGQKHLFWHNFQKMDTLHGVLHKLTDFLCKVGYDHPDVYLRTRTSLDYHEISKILGKIIGHIDAVIVFDNFQKSNEKIRDFFVYFLRMLSSPSKTKILILSREMVPFYDKRDVISKKIVAELELEGLDYNNSKKLLKEKGIDKKMFEKIFQKTAGNPLFLEFADSKDDLEKYIHDELFSKLKDDERKILDLISIYRSPIPEEFLTMHDEFDLVQLYALRQKSIVKKNYRDRYFIHDLIKQFFYNQLSTFNRKKYHLLAAQWYEKQDESECLLEAIYHYQEAQEYEKASKLAVNYASYIFDKGYGMEFLPILERFEEKEIGNNIWAEILILKGKSYYMGGEWEKALKYLIQSSDISTIIGNNELRLKAIWESGYILEEQNQFEKAMDYFNKCVDISKNTNYLLGIGIGYRGIGRVHWRKGEHDKAIYNYNKSLEISDKLGNLELSASTYIDLGNVYDEMYEIDKAIECYKKSLNLLKKIENPYETARAYGNLGITYRHIEDFEKAIEYSKKELIIAQNLHDVKLIGYSSARLGYCFAKIGDLKRANKYCKRAEDIALKTLNNNILFQVNRTYALINKHQKKWDEAVKLFKKSIDLAEDANAKYPLSEVHFELGILFKEMEDTKNAKKHIDIALGLYDELGIDRTNKMKEKLPNYNSISIK